MNISRMSFVRPVAVAVLAAGLAGCGVFAPTESADEIGASRAAEVSASDVVGDEAVSDDDDEDVGQVGPAREDVAGPPVPEPTSPPSTQSAPEPVLEDWTQAVPVFEGDFLALARPPSPEPLVDYLPETSPLRSMESKISDDLVVEISSMTQQGAAQSARHTFLGLADVLNDGTLEPVASIAATTCTFCMKLLEVAHEVHQDNDVEAEPWSLQVGLEADVQMLSGPDHLTVKFSGEDSGLTHGRGNNVVFGSLPGPTTFIAEMLFDEGQWWAVGMWLDPS